MDSINTFIFLKKRRIVSEVQILSPRPINSMDYGNSPWSFFLSVPNHGKVQFSEEQKKWLTKLKNNGCELSGADQLDLDEYSEMECCDTSLTFSPYYLNPCSHLQRCFHQAVQKIFRPLFLAIPVFRAD